MLELINVCKTFNPGTVNAKVALNDLNLTLNDGDFVTVIGGNGAGKSTMLNAIAGSFQIDSGKIVIDGSDVTGLPEHKRAALLGRVFQDPMMGTAPTMQIEENLALAARRGQHRGLKWGITKAERAEYRKCLHALDLGLEDRMTAKVGLLSGGQRQRIGIARALVMQPEFIVADEPISALDVSIRAQVLNLLNEMKKSRGLTYLFIAHDLSVVRFISDRIAVISKGRIVELAEAEELFLHPLHPYTKALLSAVPIPDPALEKNKKLLVYDPSIHDYSVEKPVWEEIANGHFVYGNQRELEGYRKEYESQL